jgi:hypothetical protein
MTSMECLNAFTTTYGDLELDVFEIAVGSGEGRMRYSPGFRMIGVAVDADSLPAEVSTIFEFMGEQDMEMEPVATAKATAEINAIETYTNNVADKVDGSSNAIGDFFLKAPFLGVILVIVAIVIVGAVFIFSKRARKP